MYLEFLRQNESLLKECYQQNQEADLNRAKHHSAAIAIQSLWRGFKVRQRIKYLNRQAVIIQSCYRGYRQKKWFHVLMFETVNQMRVNFYDLQATKIQALWRGYKSRKTKPEKHNFYKRKKYLQAVNLQNEIITEQLSRFKQQRDEEKYKLKAITEENNIIQEARRTHYLLSTRQIQGVYDPRNKNGQRRYPMDNMLRTVKPFSALDRLNNKKKLPNIGELKLEDLPSSSTILNNEGNIRNAKENEFNNYSKKAQLANQNKIRYEKAKKTNQPQGPFKKSRKEVLNQRFRPLNPSLRVSESYNTSIEEARQQLKFDNISKMINKNTKFVPVMISTKKEKYQQLLHTTSPYGHIDYGNKHFRAYENSENKQNRNSDRFANIVGPIPDFDKYMENKAEKNNNVPLWI